MKVSSFYAHCAGRPRLSVTKANDGAIWVNIQDPVDPYGIELSVRVCGDLARVERAVSAFNAAINEEAKEAAE